MPQRQKILPFSEKSVRKRRPLVTNISDKRTTQTKPLQTMTQYDFILTGQATQQEGGCYAE